MQIGHRYRFITVSNRQNLDPALSLDTFEPRLQHLSDLCNKLLNHLAGFDHESAKSFSEDLNGLLSVIQSVKEHVTEHIDLHPAGVSSVWDAEPVLLSLQGALTSLFLGLPEQDDAQELGDKTSRVTSMLTEACTRLDILLQHLIISTVSADSHEDATELQALRSKVDYLNDMLETVCCKDLIPGSTVDETALLAIPDGRSSYVNQYVGIKSLDDRGSVSSASMIISTLVASSRSSTPIVKPPSAIQSCQPHLTVSDKIILLTVKIVFMPLSVNLSQSHVIIPDTTVGSLSDAILVRLRINNLGKIRRIQICFAGVVLDKKNKILDLFPDCNTAELVAFIVLRLDGILPGLQKVMNQVLEREIRQKGTKRNYTIPLHFPIAIQESRSARKTIKLALSSVEKRLIDQALRLFD